MKSSIPVLAGLTALASAEFWVARTLTSTKPVCPVMGTCTMAPVREDTYIIRGDEKDNCDSIGARGIENGQFTDPLCPGDQDAGQPFQLTGGNVCDQPDNTKFYFRVSTTDDQKLDVAFDSGFGNIVAFCRRQADCGSEERKTCTSTGASTDVLYHYRCDAANGSTC